MVDDDRTSGNQQGSGREAPGGRSSRGPDYGHGGKPQVPVPPYDEQRGANAGEGAEGARKAFDADNAPAPGGAAPVSEQERARMSSTDTDPQPVRGVGGSRGGRAEDLAPDRDDVGTKGPAARPVGRAAEDDLDGVGDGRPRDPDSPDLQTGDQGG